MAAESKHYVDIANWVVKVIESCETHQQERAAKKLFYTWEATHGEALRWNVKYAKSYEEIRRRMRTALDHVTYERLERNKQKLIAQKS